MGSVLNVPLKGIIGFHMETANEPIPEGFVVPTGQTLSSSEQDINPGSTYTCPDLRNTFTLWGDPTKAAFTAGTFVDGPSGAPGPRAQGGTQSVTLGLSEIPPHTHSLQRQIASWNIPGVSIGTQAYIINVRDEVTHTELTQSAGGGQAHENRPRYYALIPIMRVKN